jgi:hypothetical protein
MAGALVPPVLSGAFRVMNGDGEVSRSGYFFKIYLPDAAGAGVGEPQAGYADDGSLDGDLAETTWCCYAWPVNYNQSGNRTFFTNQGGDVIGCEDADYTGQACDLSVDANSNAAFTGAGIVGSVAIGVAGNDGNTWKQVN